MRLAMNHWKLAIETHNTNFPDTDHDCTDVSAADPRRYPSTDILITSPECTTHSPAGGSRRSQPQRDMFKSTVEDPATVRSRATMWDVPRFAEYHRYNAIIVENVLEVTRWELFPEWLATMLKLGYEHRVVSLNSRFAHPTPQSRDRIYIVFWRKGNRAPLLDHTPAAPCAPCGRVVESRQTWKNNRRCGKYRQQYIYTCPTCRTEVVPFYYAGLNAIDLSLPAERIGDRKRPLRPRTLERIRYGLDRYGRMALVVRTNMTTDSGRVRPVTEPIQTQTASWLDSLVSPPGFLVETAYSHSPDRRPRDLAESLAAQSARATAALVSLPFLATAGSRETVPAGAGEPVPTLTASERLAVVTPPFVVNEHMSHRVYPVTEPLATQAASRGHDAIVVPPAAMVPQRTHSRSLSLADPLPVVCTGNHHMLAQGAALLTLRDTVRNKMVRDLADPLPTQIASSTQDWLIQNAPFLLAYKSGLPVGLNGSVPTVTTVDRVMMVGPDEKLNVEDCYFRMLQPHEIGRAMAFPDAYVVLGNKRDQVKQYGNAVTPPAMAWLIDRVTESLAPEMAA